jgi:hypothetical protein
LTFIRKMPRGPEPLLIPEMTLAQLIERVARTIYETHWRSPSPSWEQTSDEVREWVRAQALSAINELREAGWRRR